MKQGVAALTGGNFEQGEESNDHRGTDHHDEEKAEVFRNVLLVFVHADDSVDHNR
jgi:hypothetical protein